MRVCGGDECGGFGWRVMECECVGKLGSQVSQRTVTTPTKLWPPHQVVATPPSCDHTHLVSHDARLVQSGLSVNKQHVSVLQVPEYL